MADDRGLLRRRDVVAEGEIERRGGQAHEAVQLRPRQEIGVAAAHAREGTRQRLADFEPPLDQFMEALAVVQFVPVDWLNTIDPTKGELERTHHLRQQLREPHAQARLW